MSYTIPQNWNDEAMEYVNRLTDKINVGWDGEDYCLSDWNLRFFSRMNRGAIKPSFKYEAFLDSEDIIATLEGYDWMSRNSGSLCYTSTILRRILE